jgi:hypothetical protein
VSRVMGHDHPTMLKMRGDVAFWTAQTGHIHDALRLSEVLLIDQRLVQGNDHPDTLSTRANIAGWTAIVGNEGEALPLFEEVLSAQLTVLGPDHPETQNSEKCIERLKRTT